MRQSSNFNSTISFLLTLYCVDGRAVNSWLHMYIRCGLQWRMMVYVYFSTFFQLLVFYNAAFFPNHFPGRFYGLRMRVACRNPMILEFLAWSVPSTVMYRRRHSSGLWKESIKPATILRLFSTVFKRGSHYADIFHRNFSIEMNVNPRTDQKCATWRKKYVEDQWRSYEKLCWSYNKYEVEVCRACYQNIWWPMKEEIWTVNCWSWSTFRMHISWI